MTDLCLGCGTDHHWLACPEVSQSWFPYDPEWEAEEPAPPMTANVPMGPPWDPTRVEQDSGCLTTGQELSLAA